MLKLNNISFRYGDNPTIDTLSFEIAQGKHVAIIGESGCGKSTLLKLIYGIYDASQGTISYNDEAILGPRFNLIPGHQSFKYLAQDFGLMPYITVAENVGKYLSNSDKISKSNRIKELLTLMEISDYASVKAHFLSGGQQQRTALAMVLASTPKVLLLDEPFSQIDRFRTTKLRRSLYNYCHENAITLLVATHDSDDILPYADQVVVLKDGKLIQQGAPIAVYQKPESAYTAALFGQINLLPKNLLGIDASTEIIPVYPHELVLSDSGFPTNITANEFYGSYYLVECIFEGTLLYFQSPNALAVGTTIKLQYKK